MTVTLRDFWAGLLRLLWPGSGGCLWCRGPLAPSERSTKVLQGVCVGCRRELSAGPIPGLPAAGLSLVSGVASYQGGLGQAIRALKYGRRRSLAESLGEALAQAALATYPAAAATGPGDLPLLVPVPLHPARYRERGFNQSELLAREVSRRLGWPLDSNALRRVRRTQSQARLDRSARLGNLAGAFSVRPGWRPARHVVLVDDVYTTGATTASCAAALLAAGAERVDALTLAIDR